MTRVITHHPAGAENAAGRLAATLLSVAVAGIAEPGRFRRGKSYVLDNAVLRVEVEPGVLRADVIGSEPQPYQVEIRVPLVSLPGGTSAGRFERQHASVLVPDGDEIDMSCSCPDDDEPCKHAVAALLVLAQELPGRPQLLIEWRGAPGATSAPSPPIAGARARTGRHLRLVSSDHLPTSPRSASPPWTQPEWAAFEGRDVAVPNIDALVDQLPAVRIVAAKAHDLDLAAIVSGAHARMRGGLSPRRA